MDLGRDLSDYFEPFIHDSSPDNSPYQYDRIGDEAIFFNRESGVSLIEQAAIVLISYPGAPEADRIKKDLYSLSSLFPSNTIMDAGTIRKGRTKNDTEIAVRDVVSELGRKQIPMVIIGGKHEDTLKIYRAYSKLEQTVNICGIDAGIPISVDEKVTKSHYLNKILLDPENKLFDYSHISYQGYFSSPSVIELLDQLHFNHIRLGNLRKDIREAEPEFRNSDILSFSMSAIRSSDAPETEYSGPNGLYAEEACQLARFAGLSDRLSCLHLNGFNNKSPDNKATTMLSAQIIWHFLQGFFDRKKEYPFQSISNYQKFIVNVPEIGHDIHFYKSPKTNRWWLEVSYPGSKYKRSLFVACTQSDYQTACEGEIPDRWWKNFQRLS